MGALEKLVGWVRASAPDWVGQAIAGLIVAGAVTWVGGWWPGWAFRVLLALLVLVLVAGGLFAVGRRSTVAGMVGAGVVIAVATAVVTVWIVDPSESGDDAARPGPNVDPLPADSCGREPPRAATEVMVVWAQLGQAPDTGVQVGDELGSFCRVVAGLDLDVRVTSVGAEFEEPLRERVDAGDPPDVVIVPQPSFVQDQIDRDGGPGLCPIDADVTNRLPAAWQNLITGSKGSAAGEIYGMFVKGMDKSLLWYPRGAVGGRPEAWTWRDFESWVTRQRDGGSVVAPLVIPTGDAWVLTDWFENMLADQPGGPDDEPGYLYSRLSAAERDIDWTEGSEDRDTIEHVLEVMAGLWGTGDFAPLPEGHDTWRQITEPLQDGTALMAFAPSIVAGLPSDNLKPIGFPGHDASRRPLVVGGDIAVVPVQPGRSCDDLLGAKRLVDLLTSHEAISLWSQADGGYLTPNEGSPFVEDSGRQGDDLRELLTAYLRLDREGEPLSDDDPVYFDLSDNRFSVPELGGSQASSAFMAQFYADVTSHRVPTDCAVDWLVTQLASAYRGRVPDGRQSDLPSCRGT